MVKDQGMRKRSLFDVGGWGDEDLKGNGGWGGQREWELG